MDESRRVTILDDRPVRGGRLQVVDDARALAHRGAEVFAAGSEESLRERGRFTVALAGGSTPRALYEALAEGVVSPGSIEWARTHAFWGDERCVPPDHPDSNYRMARESLLSKVPIPEANVHRMRGEESEASRAAVLYESGMHAFFGLASPEVPRMDLVLLGLGADAHTASLFPGSPVLTETTRLVAAPFVEKVAAHRITLTPPVLNAAARVVFLVSGTAKADALRHVLEGEEGPQVYPAQCVRPAPGALLWIVDGAAASRLTR